MRPLIMEMRACEETEMSRDITPAVAPIAVALYGCFLSSRCSSCFLQIPPWLFFAADSTDHGRSDGLKLPPPCRGCQILRYCSVECQRSDLQSHIYSGECHFLRLVDFERREETADLRTALRLLHSFGNLGFLGSRGELRRIAGLLTGDRERMDEGCELWLRIREGRILMSRAREMLRNGISEREEDVKEIEAALWIVLTNGVEVQICEERAAGIGVYGPQFSWFNHSCSPNACYRFELRGSEYFYSERRSLVYPSSTDPKDDATMTSWIHDEGRSSRGSCRYAPRVIVRSIKPIKKGEQVCISYTDLLHPKASRQGDLWSKYAFICSCPRCSASPESYADRLLSGIKSVEGSAISDSRLQETDEQANILDEIMMDYLSEGNSKLCIAKIEQILFEGFKAGNMHRFHYLSLKAYMALASMYRAQAYDLDGGDARAAAAYALLLAGATHHLFISDPSLIVAAANFWVNAGETFLSLAQLSITDCDTIFQDHSSSLSWDEFRGTSARFLYCIGDIASEVWPALAVGIQCLGEIKSPVDFITHESLGVLDSYSREIKCIGCSYREEDIIKHDRGSVCRLTVHCLVYGAYLGTICYGPYSYWVDRIRSLLKSHTIH